jgi:predicted RNA-binding protein YlqC (UPF0109 family)
MADPKVVHPTAQNWIDFRNPSLDGPADVLSEDLSELFKQRRPLLQLGRIVGPPLPLKAEYAPKLKTQKSKTLSLSKWYERLEFGMSRDLNVEGLLLRILFVLVDDPNEVQVISDTSEAGTVFRVTVAPPDAGKIIGKNGRIASSLRVLLSAMGVAAKTQYSLNIVVKS